VNDPVIEPPLPGEFDGWFRLVVEGTPDLITIHDAQGHRLYTSPTALAMTGYTEDELNALPLGALTHPDDQSVLAEANRRVAETRKPTAFTVRIRHKSGEWRHLEAMFQVVDHHRAGRGLRMAIAHDVTERVRRENDLRTLTDRLEVLHSIDKAILRAESVGALAHSTLSRLRDMIPCERASMIQFLPESGEARVFALSANGHIGHEEDEVFPLTDLVPAEGDRGEDVRLVDDLSGVRSPSAMMRRLLALGGRSVITARLIVGEDVLGELNLTATRPGAFAQKHLSMLGEVADQLAIALQQSQLRAQLAGHAKELELRVSERTAELAELAAELDSFAYTVSHDLRAPLRAMQGFSQALMEDYGETLDDTARDYAARIDGAARAMDGLILDLLAYSRLTRADLRLGPVPLSAALESARSQLESDIAAKNATIMTGPALPVLQADRVTLVQILSNLLSNAIKFVAPGVDPTVEVRAEEMDGVVRVWVEDNGIGIDVRHAERVFKMFERLHGMEAYSGTGVGLAIVRKAVERMGGRVGVQSETGSGSRFWFELAKAE
jgi:PAS domain S-box-containing protein